MKTIHECIAKIEATLSEEIEAAALKRDLNKMVLALTDSVKHLVTIAKETATAFEGLIGLQGHTEAPTAVATVPTPPTAVEPAPAAPEAPTGAAAAKAAEEAADPQAGKVVDGVRIAKASKAPKVKAVTSKAAPKKRAQKHPIAPK